MDNILGLFEKLDNKSLSVYPNRCVAVRNKNASCRKCADLCPSGAITIENNTLDISPERCVGCCLCASVCPTEALQAKSPDNNELLRQAIAAMQANDNVVVIASKSLLQAAAGQYDPAKVAEVENVARINEGLLAVLAAGGATKILLVDHALTAPEEDTNYGVKSVQHAVNITAKSIVNATKTLLETWNCPTKVIITDKLPSSVRLEQPEVTDESKRRFFSDLRKEIGSATNITAEHVIAEKLGAEEEAKAKLTKVQEDGTLPHFLPEGRAKLLFALSHMGQPKDEMIDTPLFGQVTIDPDICSSCLMCAVFCPTEAIHKFGNPKTAAKTKEPFGIDYYTGRCVQCHCCEDVCPIGALTLSTNVFAIDVTNPGKSERTIMQPRKRKVNSPDSILNAMRALNIPNIYER